MVGGYHHGARRGHRGGDHHDLGVQRFMLEPDAT